MAEAPKVYCPREGKKVPVWWCIGGYVQRRSACSGLQEITVDQVKDSAKVGCSARNFINMRMSVYERG